MSWQARRRFEPRAARSGWLDPGGPGESPARRLSRREGGKRIFCSRKGTFPVYSRIEAPGWRKTEACRWRRNNPPARSTRTCGKRARRRAYSLSVSSAALPRERGGAHQRFALCDMQPGAAQPPSASSRNGLPSGRRLRELVPISATGAINRRYAGVADRARTPPTKRVRAQPRLAEESPRANGTDSKSNISTYATVTSSRSSRATFTRA